MDKNQGRLIDHEPDGIRVQTMRDQYDIAWANIVHFDNIRYRVPVEEVTALFNAAKLKHRGLSTDANGTQNGYIEIMLNPFTARSDGALNKVTESLVELIKSREI